MANLVEFLVRLKDMASGPLQKLGATGQNAFGKIQQAMDKVSDKTGVLKQNIVQIDNQLGALTKTRSIGFDSSQIRRINSEIDQLQAKINKLESGGSSGGSGNTGSNVLEKMAESGNVLNFKLGSSGKMTDKGHKKSFTQGFSKTSIGGHSSGRQDAGFNQETSSLAGHKTSGSLPDMKKGKAGINGFIGAIQNAAGPIDSFISGMQKMQQTPADKYAAFTGTLQSLAGTIGTNLLPSLGGVNDFLNGLINNSGALTAVATCIDAMNTAWDIYTGVTELAATWQGILEGIALWPITVIAAIIALITYLCLKYDGWGKSMKAIWEIAKDVGKLMVIGFKQEVSTIAYVFEGLFLTIISGFEYVGQLIKNVMKAINLALHFDFKEAGQALTAPIKTEASDRLEKLNKDFAASSKANVTDVVSVVKDMGRQVKDIGVTAKKDDGKKNSFDLGSLFGNKPSPPGGAAAGAAGSGGSSVPSGGATTSAITSGGVRNITINVAKFQDKTEIHTVGLKEGIQEVEEIIRDMFLRVTNSASAALN